MDFCGHDMWAICAMKSFVAYILPISTLGAHFLFRVPASDSAYLGIETAMSDEIKQKSNLCYTGDIAP